MICLSEFTFTINLAKQKGGKWVMTSSDLGVEHNLKAYSIKDWQWANKYIDLTEYLKKVERMVGMRI